MIWRFPFPSFWDPLLKILRCGCVKRTEENSLIILQSWQTACRSAVPKIPFDDGLNPHALGCPVADDLSISLPVFTDLIFYNTNGYFTCYHLTNVLLNWVWASLSWSSVPVQRAIPGRNGVKATVKLGRAGGCQSTYNLACLISSPGKAESSLPHVS